MTRQRQIEAFEEVEKELKIPVRTCRLYIQEKLFPSPELDGRAGYYSDKDQILERAGIIKILRKKGWRCSLDAVRRVLRKYENGDLGKLRSLLEYVDEQYPLMVDVKPEKGQTKMTKRWSSFNELLRQKFYGRLLAELVNNELVDNLAQEIKNMTPQEFEEDLYGYGIEEP